MEVDPIAQFFPDNPDVNLYDVLSIPPTATASEVKSAYRHLALLHHPDKHAASSPETQQNASMRFQQIGFAYSILGDEKRRKKYGDTGSVDEGIDLDDSDGWETYFEEMFEKVTRSKMDEMKKRYQGSEEEYTDLRMAYLETGGSIEEIIRHIPHSNYTDEPRFIETINELIAKGDLNALPAWSKGLKDVKGRASRKRKGVKEAQEAEGMAKELGVWDEFYGTGKKGKRMGTGKEKSTSNGEGGTEGETALKTLIKSRQNKLGSFFDKLAAKYEDQEESKSRGKKRAAEPDIDEEEFARIQQRLNQTPMKRSKYKRTK